MGDNDKDEKQSEADGVGGQQARERDSTTARQQEENVDYKDMYLRAAADYDNLRKESAKLRADYARYAACEVVEQVLPVLDNLKKALEHAPTEESCAQWVGGVALIREQFEKVLEAAGVKAIGVTGEKFDPAVHDALMREKREGVEPDTVAQVVEPGYKMHDKVLRPAKVIVAE